MEIGGVAYLDNKKGSQFLSASFTSYVPQNIECRRHPNEQDNESACNTKEIQFTFVHDARPDSRSYRPRSGNMAVAKHDRLQSVNVFRFRKMRPFVQNVGQKAPMEANPALQIDL